MLYRLALYQVVSCSISLLSLLYFVVIAQAFRLPNPFSYILCAVLLALTIFVLYLNTEYVTKRKITPRFKWVNQWFNIVQLLNFSLVGVTYYFLAGLEITPEFTYNESISGQLLLNFGFSFSLTYQKSASIISAGINLVPILYLYLFHHAVRKAETAEKFELDLFKPKSKR